MGRRPPPGPGVTCYACHAPATTWEHAPPKAFYPKRGEVRLASGKRDLRLDLIQVPSCVTHNNGKSRTDNYVATYLVVVAASIVDVLDPRVREPFVERHLDTLRRGTRISKDFFENPSYISTPRGVEVSISPDIATIHTLEESIARALYYHEGFEQTGSWITAQKWTADLNVADMQLRAEDGSPSLHHAVFEELERKFEALREGGHPGGKHRGPHPEAFYYQLLHLPDGSAAMRMVFYEAYRIVVFQSAA